MDDPAVTPETPLDLLIRGGDVVLDAAVQRLDVGIRDGRIVALAPQIDTPAGRTIDASGQIIFPGCIDPHTHMGIPIKDTFSADDFTSGSIAAACGGTTTIIDFTVQEPGQTLRQALDVRLEKAAGQCHVDYAVHVNITDRPEQHLDEIPQLISDGFTSFKAFTTYREAGMMMPPQAFRPVLQRIHEHGGLLLLHAEDNTIIERETARHIAAGHRAPIYHARSRPAEAEAAAISWAATVAAEVGAPLYIVHLSSQAGLEAARQARAQGATLYLETCPHYLIMDGAAYQRDDGHLFITTPPLRTPADREALWQAVIAGEIDTIGTDHCPFTRAQKDAYRDRFHEVPNGLPAVETRFALLYTYGVGTGWLSLPQLGRLLAGNAARIFGLERRKGSLHPGADADLLIWDPHPQSTITAANQHGRADWTPYQNVPVTGRLAYTILRGQVLVEDGRFLPAQPQGQLLRR